MPKQDRFEIKAEVTDKGVKVHISPTQWVLLSKVWTWANRNAFEKASRESDNLALPLALDATLDWHVLDVNGNAIPFDRDALKANIEVWQVPTAFVAIYVGAVWKAIGESYAIPLA